MLRKKDKLPADVHSVDFELEYGKATIEVHKDSINKDESVLIIDDLIATGGTAEAAAKLIEISGTLGGYASLMKERLLEITTEGLPENWDGVYEAKTK